MGACVFTGGKNKGPFFFLFLLLQKNAPLWFFFSFSFALWVPFLSNSWFLSFTSLVMSIYALTRLKQLNPHSSNWETAPSNLNCYMLLFTIFTIYICILKNKPPCFKCLDFCISTKSNLPSRECRYTSFYFFSYFIYFRVEIY